jgi:tetratricopeptide (TPR) repeat protein
MTTMNKIILSIFIYLISFSLFSQIKRPNKSFLQKVEQRVGLTDIKLEYYRPSMKGRTIFGGLVRYKELWRTGANKNTIITFSNAVEIDGKELDAGTYSIFTKPDNASWTIYFYKDTENWGVPKNWNNERIALQITVPTFKLNRDVETLIININNIKESSGNLEIMWERILVTIPIEFRFKELLEVSTKNELDRNADDFHIAAVNYSERNYDLNQAKTWMEKAIHIRENPDYWDYREYSLILAKLGNYKKAIEAAKYSTELSKALNNDAGDRTIELNKKSIKEWGKAKK